MAAFQVVWGVVLIAAGLALALWGWRAMRTRPGWGGFRGRGALITMLGAFLAAGGVVNLVLGLA
jgi:hypothetical protein